MLPAVAVLWCCARAGTERFARENCLGTARVGQHALRTRPATSCARGCHVLGLALLESRPRECAGHSKPDGGALVTLVDSGGETGLERVQMMEGATRGLGFYLLSQFPVAGRYEAEPMAGELLQRSMAYAAGGKPFRIPESRLLVSRSWFRGRDEVHNAGVSLAVVADAPLGEASILLVDAGQLPASFQLPGRSDALLRGHVDPPRRSPGTWRLAFGPNGQAGLLDGTALGHVGGAGLSQRLHVAHAGLSQVDLYWEGTTAEGAGSQANDPSLKIEDPSTGRPRRSAVEHIFPGGLVEIPVGRGRVVLDQLRWETPNPALERLSGRVVSALMTGLGVAIEPYTPARALPEKSPTSRWT